MNVTVDYIIPAKEEDPKGADYMIGLSHISGPSWLVPVTKEELAKMQPWIPKDLRTVAIPQKG